MTADEKFNHILAGLKLVADELRDLRRDSAEDRKQAAADRRQAALDRERSDERFERAMERSDDRFEQWRKESRTFARVIIKVAQDIRRTLKGHTHLLVGIDRKLSTGSNGRHRPGGYGGNGRKRR